MRKFTSGRLAGALVAVLATLVLASFSSSATAVPYCGIPVPAFSACSSTTGSHLITTNIAQYTGAGSISVCQKIQQGAAIWERTCGIDYASNTGAPFYGYYVGYVGNNSQWTHTINGTYHAADVAGRSAGSSATEVDTSAAPPAFAQRQLRAIRAGGEAVTTIARPNDQVALRAGADRLCLESTLTNGATCQTYEKTVAGGLLMTGVCSPDLPADQIGVYGVAPAGYNTVKAVAANGSVIASTAVISNTFALLLNKGDAAQVDHFESVGTAGTRSLGNVIPPDLGC